MIMPASSPSRRITRWGSWTLGVLVLFIVASGAFGGAPAHGATLDDRVYAVARQLFCPVCQGQTVAESGAAVAREMRAIIRQKLVEGETPDQILSYFVGQFGEQVLAEPPRHGFSLLLYLGPAAALLAGLCIAAAVIRRWTRRAAPAAAAGPPGDPADLELLARELDARPR
jgi:cytochrome c-type biogenesis protein CcmH